MNYLKCVLVGCAASVLSGIVYIVISLVLSSSVEVGGVGFTAVATAFTAGPLLLVVLLAGFAIGFIWMLKRTSGHRLNS